MDRRNFIKKAGLGTVAAGLALIPGVSGLTKEDKPEDKPKYQTEIYGWAEVGFANTEGVSSSRIFYPDPEKAWTIKGIPGFEGSFAGSPYHGWSKIGMATLDARGVHPMLHDWSEIGPYDDKEILGKFYRLSEDSELKYLTPGIEKIYKDGGHSYPKYMTKEEIEELDKETGLNYTRTAYVPMGRLKLYVDGHMRIDMGKMVQIDQNAKNVCNLWTEFGCINLGIFDYNSYRYIKGLIETERCFRKGRESFIKPLELVINNDKDSGWDEILDNKGIGMSDDIVGMEVEIESGMYFNYPENLIYTVPSAFRKEKNNG